VREVAQLNLAECIILYSTFFTSLWLWLYALSMPLSRVLPRMNSGVGFLLPRGFQNRSVTRARRLAAVFFADIVGYTDPESHQSARLARVMIASFGHIRKRALALYAAVLSSRVRL